MLLKVYANYYLTVKKSENSFTADKWDASPLVATFAFNSRETLPFNRGVPLDDMAASVERGML